MRRSPLLNADFGNILLYSPGVRSARDSSRHRGFRQDFSDTFGRVHDGNASCGEAMKRRERLVITEDQWLTDPSSRRTRIVSPPRATRGAVDTVDRPQR
jgi:hypothetical protein